MQYRLVRPDGALRWISARTFPVHDEKGELHRVVGIAEDITVRKQEEAALRAAHQKLHVALRESEQRAKEASKLSELVDILQSCQSVDEAYQIAGGALPRILASNPGALCIISPSRNMVERSPYGATSSRRKKPSRQTAAGRCGAAKLHPVDDPSSPMRCGHVHPQWRDTCACRWPPTARLSACCSSRRPAPRRSRPGCFREDQMAALTRQGTAIGERMSLALSTLRLREVLRSQSIRDPLTGLFNRRYMEESLERELRRAERNGQPVGSSCWTSITSNISTTRLAIRRGDALLRALGDLLSERTRGQDVACRYGGEEFSLIPPGRLEEAALQTRRTVARRSQAARRDPCRPVAGQITLRLAWPRIRKTAAPRKSWCGPPIRRSIARKPRGGIESCSLGMLEQASVFASSFSEPAIKAG